MKLSLITSKPFQDALKKLMGEQLPIKAAFKLKGIAIKVQSENDKYEEVRKNALTSYGAKNEDGSLVVAESGAVSLTGDNLENFVKELNDALALDVQFDTVNLSDLGEKINMSADELLLLGDIIV